jgi:hypothetical protein
MRILTGARREDENVKTAAMSTSAIQSQRLLVGVFELLVDANLFSFQSAAGKAVSDNLPFPSCRAISGMVPV